MKSPEPATRIIHVPPQEFIQFKHEARMGEDWLSFFLDPQDLPSWRYDLKGSLGHWTEFRCMGDLLATGKIMAVISPEERYEENGDEDQDEETRTTRWEIQCFHDEYFINEPINQGLSRHRIADGVPEDWRLFEKAFADEWERINREEGGMRNGLGHLQSRVCADCNSKDYPPPPEFQQAVYGEYITQRERILVAEIVQWMGTNCGRSFLHEVNQRTGGKLFPTLSRFQ